jgi:glycosyltransferase involved in cell wall biosynthesis
LVTVRISVVIPTYNEAPAIGRVLSDIPEMVEEVLVVDSGSSDGTAEIALELGPRSCTSRAAAMGAHA